VKGGEIGEKVGEQDSLCYYVWIVNQFFVWSKSFFFFFLIKTKGWNFLRTCYWLWSENGNF